MPNDVSIAGNRRKRCILTFLTVLRPHFSFFGIDFYFITFYNFYEVIILRYPVMRGDEPFTIGSEPIPTTVKDFWAWSMSRLLADGPRGDLAEFIVNTALGIDTTDAKHGWGECDILYGGYRIEVKCSSLLQAWDRDTPPRPVFSISKTVNCDIKETESGLRYIGRDNLPPQRRSEIYIFCLFAHTERSSADPLNLSQWQFYVVPTALINERCGNRRSISFPGITNLGVTSCTFNGIKPKVDSIIDNLIKQKEPQDN